MKTIPKHTFEFLDSWIELRRWWENLPGISVAIAKNGKIVYKQAFGQANRETKEKLTPRHLHRFASHSKTFTATAIMQLAEQGKLRIDDHVVDYLGWLAKHKDKRWKTVTIRQLLSHSAGLIRDGEDTDFWQLARPFPTKQELQKSVLSAKLVFDPNVQHKYSNYGFGLLGLIIEEVSGQPYATFVTNGIIKPLGLKNTYPDYDESLKDRLAVGYARYPIVGRPPLPHIPTGALAAATGFCSTPEDIALYFSAQMIGSKKLLSDESKREMQRMQWHAEPDTEGSYGLGFEIDKYGERNVFGHSGGFPGFSSRTLADTSDRYVISVVGTSDAFEGGPAARGIMAAIDELGGDEPKKSLVKFEGRFADLGTFVQVVVKGDKLTLIWPNWWQTFDETEALEYVNDKTLRITWTNSYYSNGELIHYHFKNGKIDHIVNAGSTMFPSETGEIPAETWKRIGSAN